MSGTLRDKIINSQSADRMLGRVSPIYDNSYVGLWIFEAIGREYDGMWDIVNSLPDQLFPQSVTWAIELWEQRYGIVPSSTQTLEERRQAIIAARSVPAPLLPSTLEKYIYNLTGRETRVTDYVRDFTFGIEVVSSDGMRGSDLKEIMAYINRHKPSHMSYDLLFQSEAQITIGVETGYWRFPYRMTGMAKAGQLPEVSTIFHENEGNVLVAPSPVAYRFPYTLAGMVPEVNNAVSVINADVDVDADAGGFLFAYGVAGEETAGTQPEYVITSGSDASSIRASPSGEAFGITYPMCGAVSAGTTTL